MHGAGLELETKVHPKVRNYGKGQLAFVSSSSAGPQLRPALRDLPDQTPRPPRHPQYLQLQLRLAARPLPGPRGARPVLLPRPRHAQPPLPRAGLAAARVPGVAAEAGPGARGEADTAVAPRPRIRRRARAAGESWQRTFAKLHCARVS